MEKIIANILIVEDDKDINDLICDAFSDRALNSSDELRSVADEVHCVQTFSGTQGLAEAKNGSFDLIITDLMLPGLDGSQMIAEIRRIHTDIPVIVLSALTELDTKVKLLSLGAEDYITKPFEMRELTARAAVQLRRFSKKSEVRNSLRWRSVVLNKSDHTVTASRQDEDTDKKRDPVPILLTKIEFKILELLLSNPKKVFSKQDIYDFAWGDFYIGEDKTINVHIGNIRRKLKNATGKECIETVWGVGFRMAKD